MNGQCGVSALNGSVVPTLSRILWRLTRWLRARQYMYLHMRLRIACGSHMRTGEGKMSATPVRSSRAVWPAWAKRRLVSDESRRFLTMEAMMEMKSREDEDDYSSR